MLTARCNAGCGHCGTNCGPQRSEALPREKVLSLMDEAAALSRGQPLEFGLTGGEPFLDFGLLRDVVSHGKRLGAEMGVVSNGSWAATDAEAERKLAVLKDAGLGLLNISTSRFHEAFISARRVERALRAARKVGLACSLKYVRAGSDTRSPDQVRQWAETAGADSVQDFPLLPYLREGEALPARDYARVDGLPAGPCPGPMMTVSWDGRAYPCCSPGAFNPFLALGSVHEMALAELRDRFYLSGKQQILREHGPIRFAKAVRTAGLASRLRKSYVSVCEMCTHIANDPAMAAVADEAAAAFEMQQLEKILAADVVSAREAVVQQTASTQGDHA